MLQICTHYKNPTKSTSSLTSCTVIVFVTDGDQSPSSRPLRHAGSSNGVTPFNGIVVQAPAASRGRGPQGGWAIIQAVLVSFIPRGLDLKCSNPRCKVNKMATPFHRYTQASSATEILDWTLAKTVCLPLSSSGQPTQRLTEQRRQTDTG